LQAFIGEHCQYDTLQLTNFKEVRTIHLQILAGELTARLKQIDKLKPVLNEKPTYWRLTIPSMDETQKEELVLSMQGVILNKDLPPVLKRCVFCLIGF
jgi:hypothetical protein